jgi:hypothetical protein
MEKINLVLDEKYYPMVLRQYGLEGAKDQAIRMALALYKERPITETHLYSCLANLESDLQTMFPPPLTQEEKEEAKREAREEAEYYQSEIAEMKPYLVDGKQMMVDQNGEPATESSYQYPVWENKCGALQARVYDAGWDWILPSRRHWEDEDD